MLYPVWPSSGASVRGGAAIYKLGLGEVSKGVSSEEVSALDVSNGRKSPATSAHALILNGGNCSLGGPMEKPKLMLTPPSSSRAPSHQCRWKVTVHGSRVRTARSVSYNGQLKSEYVVFNTSFGQINADGVVELQRRPITESIHSAQNTTDFSCPLRAKRSI